MGIPFFFKWLRAQCRKAVVTAFSPEQVNGCDNLYLDLNGILHTFFKTESPNWQENFDIIMQESALYIMKIVDLCKPTGLIFLALDGVPPKSKLNQQRSRRFLSAYEKEVVNGMHSNMITPGTEFMVQAGEYLRKFLGSQAQEEWKGLQIIFSDSNQPGEGEHKIFGYLRKIRSQPNYNPNTRHIIYGPDADLIVLGLGIHEAHISILREDPKPGRSTPYNKGRVIFVSGYTETTPDEDLALIKSFCSPKKVLQIHLVAKRASGLAYVEFDDKETSTEVLLALRGMVARGKLLRSGIAVRLPEGFAFAQADKTIEISSKPFLLVSVATIRVYLERVFSNLASLPDYSFSRLVDDLVLLTVLVGNDFLPALPGLAIEEGALDLLISLYVRYRSSLDGYLTDNGSLNLSNFHSFITVIASVEEKLQNRHTYIRQADNLKRMDKTQRILHYNRLRAQKFDILGIPAQDEQASEEQGSTVSAEEPSESAEDLEEEIETVANVSIVDYENEIDYSRPGYPERYYQALFGSSENQLLDAVSEAYWEGVQWILKYYSQGPPAWYWSFDYHFAPLSTTLAARPPKPVNFVLNSPVEPFEQLLLVLPPKHDFLLPEPLQGLRQPSSKRLVLNMTGKTVSWQAVPIVDFLAIAPIRELIAPLRDPNDPRNVVHEATSFCGPYVNPVEISVAPALLRIGISVS